MLHAAAILADVSVAALSTRAMVAAGLAVVVGATVVTRAAVLPVAAVSSRAPRTRDGVQRRVEHVLCNVLRGRQGEQGEKQGGDLEAKHG